MLLLRRGFRVRPPTLSSTYSAFRIQLIGWDLHIQEVCDSAEHHHLVLKNRTFTYPTGLTPASHFPVPQENNTRSEVTTPVVSAAQLRNLLPTKVKALIQRTYLGDLNLVSGRVAH